MKNNKMLAVSVLSSIGIASTIAATKLAMDDKGYFWFLSLAFCVAYWAFEILVNEGEK
jgi:hypothetical protein